MIKALIFINGCSLKKRSNDEHDLLRLPRRASLNGLYAALLISTRSLHGCSILDNAGAYCPEQPFSSINALPLSHLILAETSISR
ncbi:MAG: hypothetical protein COB35_03995 [Gammaproteobacteria bacterium]|nr:MAG: hypothetical protein COB35_03995 [Gammaproteobacteria bacterium]